MDRLRSIRRVAALRELALARNATDEADAMERYLSNSTGGNLSCPVGEFIVMNYLRTGDLPAGAAQPAPQDLEEAASILDSCHGSWPEAVTQAFGRSRAEALSAGDTTLVKALKRCLGESTWNPRCPMNSFLDSRRPN
jgi:hypothetical protein